MRAGAPYYYFTLYNVRRCYSSRELPHNGIDQMCKTKMYAVKCKLRQAEKDYVHDEIYNNPNIASMWKVIWNCVPRKETTKPSYSGDVKKLTN